MAGAVTESQFSDLIKAMRKLQSVLSYLIVIGVIAALIAIWQISRIEPIDRPIPARWKTGPSPEEAAMAIAKQQGLDAPLSDMMED